MPSTGQELVRSLFDYVIAYTQIKSPYARNIVQQPWSQYLGEIPQHEAIQFTPPVSSDTASGWQLLKIGRAAAPAGNSPRLDGCRFEEQGNAEDGSCNPE
ncbi:hypothetical protein [Tunturiibacter gelidoferens]|uniref:Uncharacterized protein n=2 Tax=Tunturiibacter TaxID=3154218 RepID=A0A7Y9T965_9BACT|nr:hypothetical protein [Edaphobacter lichenicola]MBB5339590.1 hypothetical protein [Edaphobacter lichenicola]NYF51135.1 hypothetical protein [Edaphobacter lichenicola]